MSWAADSVAKSVMVYGIAFAVAGATPFILLPILTKTLSPTEFGKATSFIILALMVGNFAGLSSHGFVSVRYFKSTPIEFKSLVSSSIVAVCATHLLALALVPALSSSVFRLFTLSIGQASL